MPQPTPVDVNAPPTADVETRLVSWSASYLFDLARVHFNQAQFYHILRACWEQEKDQVLLQKLTDTLLSTPDKRAQQLVWIAARQMKAFVALNGVDNVKLPKRGLTVEALQEDLPATEVSVRDYIGIRYPEAELEDVRRFGTPPATQYKGVVAGFSENPTPRSRSHAAVNDEQTDKGGSPSMQFVPTDGSNLVSVLPSP
jgi:hypothetical protein